MLTRSPSVWCGGGGAGFLVVVVEGLKFSPITCLISSVADAALRRRGREECRVRRRTLRRDGCGIDGFVDEPQLEIRKRPLKRLLVEIIPGARLSRLFMVRETDNHFAEEFTALLKLFAAGVRLK